MCSAQDDARHQFIMVEHGPTVDPAGTHPPPNSLSELSDRIATALPRAQPLAPPGADPGLSMLPVLALESVQRGTPAGASDSCCSRCVSTATNRPNAPNDEAGEGGPRGRSARRPAEIPQAGWRDVLKRVWTAIGKDNVSLISAGLAMYALLAVFPSLAAAISIYGIFATPAQVIQDMNAFAGILPPGAWEIFSKQLQEVARHTGSTLTATAAVALLVSLWSGRSGMSALITATNIAYSEAEKRGFIRLTLISLAFTAGGILAFLLMLLLGVALPLMVKAFGVSGGAEAIVGILRWILLWLVAIVGLAVIYRYAPARNRPQWRWVTWGSVVAATLWLLGSLSFAMYVRTFASYGKTYGALGGVIVLLMWFYVSSFTIVLGAEINAEMERQTHHDTTEGHQKPLGERGAYAADTVGPAANE
jgi:membrane protein